LGTSIADPAASYWTMVEDEARAGAAEYIAEEVLDNGTNVFERFAIPVGSPKEVIDQRHLQPAAFQ